MKIALRYTESKLEKPQIVGVCHKFNHKKEETDCACSYGRPRRQKTHVMTIPHGKRYFDCTPCKPADALMAERQSYSEKLEFYRPLCCPKC